jgi:hypothetical protein
MQFVEDVQLVRQAKVNVLLFATRQLLRSISLEVVPRAGKCQ